MTTVTDQFTQLANRSQESFFSAVRVWQNTLRSYPGATLSTEAVPDACATVDAAFDLAARLLDNQREFTTALVSVATKTFETIAEQTTHIANQAAGAAHREADVPAKAPAPVQPAEPRDQLAARTEPASKTTGTTGAAGPTPTASPKRPRDGRRTDDA